MTSSEDRTAQARQMFNVEAIQARLDGGASVTLSADGAVQAMCDLVATRDDVRWLLTQLEALTAASAAKDERLRQLLADWREIIRKANTDGPIPADEVGHANRWEMADALADELERVLSESR